MNTRSFFKQIPTPIVVFLFALLATVIVSSCQKDSTDPTPVTQSMIKQIASDEAGGVLTLDGSSLIVPPNSIPSLANGNAATVSFTIEKGGALPKSLPSNMKLVGETTHFGPEGFIFQDPMWILFTLPDGTAPDQVCVVGFNTEMNMVSFRSPIMMKTRRKSEQQSTNSATICWRMSVRSTGLVHLSEPEVSAYGLIKRTVGILQPQIKAVGLVPIATTS
jgi:hypothetical protein